MSIVPSLWKSDKKLAIGMVHLRPLPGSPKHEESLSQIILAAQRDAEAIIDGGMDGLLIENFGDAPFYSDQVPAVTVASMTLVTAELRRRFDVPTGINVLRNDACSALAIAHATRANFVRVNILCGARVTDQGIVQGQAHQLMRLRKELSAGDVQIWADVQVKHSGPLAPRPIQEEVEEVILRGQADAVIVTGPGTSRQASSQELKEVKRAATETPVLVGSGVDANNLAEWISMADGVIVGSSLKKNGRADQPVDPESVRRFVEALRNG